MEDPIGMQRARLLELLRTHAFQRRTVTLSSGKTLTYLLIGVVVIAVMELNALGKISGRGNTGLNVIYESHKNAMYAGFGLIVAFYILAEILLRY